MLLICQVEFMYDALLGRGDASWVRALDNIGKSLRKVKMDLLDEAPVLYDVYCNVVVDVSEHVNVDVDVSVNLYYIFRDKEKKGNSYTIYVNAVYENHEFIEKTYKNT